MKLAIDDSVPQQGAFDIRHREKDYRLDLRTTPAQYGENLEMLLYASQVLGVGRDCTNVAAYVCTLDLHFCSGNIIHLSAPAFIPPLSPC